MTSQCGSDSKFRSASCSDSTGQGCSCVIRHSYVKANDRGVWPGFASRIGSGQTEADSAQQDLVESGGGMRWSRVRNTGTRSGASVPAHQRTRRKARESRFDRPSQATRLISRSFSSERVAVDPRISTNWAIVVSENCDHVGVHSVSAAPDSPKNSSRRFLPRRARLRAD